MVLCTKRLKFFKFQNYQIYHINNTENIVMLIINIMDYYSMISDNWYFRPLSCTPTLYQKDLQLLAYPTTEKWWLPEMISYPLLIIWSLLIHSKTLSSQGPLVHRTKNHLAAQMLSRTPPLWPPQNLYTLPPHPNLFILHLGMTFSKSIYPVSAFCIPRQTNAINNLKSHQPVLKQYLAL